MAETHTAEIATVPAAKPTSRGPLYTVSTILFAVVMVIIWLVLVGAMLFPVYLSRR